MNVWSVCRRSSLSHTKGVGGRKAHATILVPQPALHPGRPLDAVSTTAQARSDGGLTAGRADLAGFFRRPRSAGAFTALVASSSELVHTPTPSLRRRPFQRPPNPGKGPGSIQATLGPAFDGYALRRWYVVRRPAPGWRPSRYRCCAPLSLLCLIAARTRRFHCYRTCLRLERISYLSSHIFSRDVTK